MICAQKSVWAKLIVDYIFRCNPFYNFYESGNDLLSGMSEHMASLLKNPLEDKT